MGELTIKLLNGVDLFLDEKDEDGTVYIDMSIGSSCNYGDINQDQAKQIIQHLQEQFGLC